MFRLYHVCKIRCISDVEFLSYVHGQTNRPDYNILTSPFRGEKQILHDQRLALFYQIVMNNNKKSIHVYVTFQVLIKYKNYLRRYWFFQLILLTEIISRATPLKITMFIKGLLLKREKKCFALY